MAALLESAITGIVSVFASVGLLGIILRNQNAKIDRQDAVKQDKNQCETTQELIGLKAERAIENAFKEFKKEFYPQFEEVKNAVLLMQDNMNKRKGDPKNG